MINTDRIISWKRFKNSFPYICTKCGKLSNMEREYCENCGAKDSLRAITKDDYLNIYGEEIKTEKEKFRKNFRKKYVENWRF